MSEDSPNFICHGCATTVDIAREPPFACPKAGSGDVDHVLVPDLRPDRAGQKRDDNPFVRYRHLMSPYRLNRFFGLTDDDWMEIVGKLDGRLMAVDGRTFRITPLSSQPALADALPSRPRLLVKDETANVAGSHKGRHLMAVMLYLCVLEAANHPSAAALRKRRLAIASCGNAALAAAVIARAADWALDAYIPKDANPLVVNRLRELGASITICERRSGESGDPCVSAFREAVRNGAIPFSVQGPENGLAVEGARTIAFEMAEQFSAKGALPADIYIQVGGGALASAVAQGFGIARQTGLLAKSPRIILVQTTGCAPIVRAWTLLSDVRLEEAVKHRSRFMWPWEKTPSSAATGILDDETYDWWEAIKGARDTGGRAIAADETTILRAHDLARTHSTIRSSTTGTAGLAGLLSAGPSSEPAAVIFSGSDRYGT